MVLCFPAERPEQGSCERPPGDLRPDALLHRRGRDEPTGDAGHHALPHHLRRHRVRLLRAMHAVRPQPEEAGQVQGARDRAGERLKSGIKSLYSSTTVYYRQKFFCIVHLNQ